MMNRYFPKDDVKLLIRIMYHIRNNCAKSKANKYRYKYLKELCKSIIKELQEDKDFENANIFKELLKDIKSFNPRVDDGRYFRDMKYDYVSLDKLYKLGVFEPLEVNENET